MRKVLLDTDILSEYLKGHDPSVARHAAKYAELHGYFSFTSVTVHEIVFGLEIKNAHKQLEKTLQWLSLNEEIAPTATDYLVAARIKATARRAGLTVELPDCLIAAAAVRLRVPLVSGNTSDFEAVRNTGVDLALENWREE